MASVVHRGVVVERSERGCCCREVRERVLWWVLDYVWGEILVRGEILFNLILIIHRYCSIRHLINLNMLVWSCTSTVAIWHHYGDSNMLLFFDNNRVLLLNLKNIKRILKIEKHL
jgi:hypothetical protein